MLGRFDDRAVSGREGRCHLPSRHQNREVPRDDLRDDAKRFLDIYGQRVRIKLGCSAFFGTNYAGKIAEMIDRQRQIGGHRFANRLAVVPRLGSGKQFEVLFHFVGDLPQQIAARCRRSIVPFGSGFVCRIES